jgi:hypothetical protein
VAESATALVDVVEAERCDLADLLDDFGGRADPPVRLGAESIERAVRRALGNPRIDLRRAQHPLA